MSARDPAVGPDRVGAGVDHLVERGVDPDLVAAHDCAQRPADPQPVERDHGPGIGRPPADLAAGARPASGTGRPGRRRGSCPGSRSAPTPTSPSSSASSTGGNSQRPGGGSTGTGRPYLLAFCPPERSPGRPLRGTRTRRCGGSSRDGQARVSDGSVHRHAGRLERRHAHPTHRPRGRRRHRRHACDRVGGGPGAAPPPNRPGGPTARRPADRHRPPRRQRLPPRAHAGVVLARHRPRRRLRRARPGQHQGRRPRRPPRERDRRHHRRRQPPGVRRPPDHQGDRRRDASPAGSPRTSRWPSSRRCGPRSGIPAIRPANTRLRRPVRDPDLRRRSSTSWPRRTRAGAARRIGIYPETKHPTYFDSIGLSLEEPLVATLEAQRLPRPRRPVLHPVVRGRQPPPARHDDPAAAGPAVQRHRPAVRLRGRRRPAHVRRHGHAGRPGRVATYADGIGADKTWSSRAAPTATWARRRRWWPTPTAQRLIVHIYTLRIENNFVPPDCARRRSEPAGQRRGRVRGVLGRRHRRPVQRQPRHRRRDPGRPPRPPLTRRPQASTPDAGVRGGGPGLLRPGARKTQMKRWPSGGRRGRPL